MSEMPTSCLSCCAAPQLPEERTTKSEATGLLVERPTLYDLNPLSLAYWRLMLVRLWGTIQVTVTKLFFAGMGWQVGATIASNSGAYSKSLSYALLSGLGEATGVLIGHIIYVALKLCLDTRGGLSRASDGLVASAMLTSDLWDDALYGGIALSVGAFAGGSMWQPMLNWCSDAGLGFTASAFCVGIVCASLFFLALCVARIVRKHCCSRGAPPDHCFPTLLEVRPDILLCLSLVGGYALFCSTDVIDFGTENWARGWFGVYPVYDPCFFAHQEEAAPHNASLPHLGFPGSPAAVTGVSPPSGVAAGAPAGPSAYFRDVAGRELWLGTGDNEPFAGLLGPVPGPNQQLPGLNNSTGGSPDCSPVFAGTSTGYAILLAGYSTMLGFFIFQVAQNLVVPPGMSWLDPEPKKRLAEVEGIKAMP